MRLGIDVDGVLAQFNEAFINLLIKVSGKDLFPTRPFEIPTWDYPTHYNYTAADQTMAWAVIEASPTFWLDLTHYEDAPAFLEFLSTLNDAHDLYFITSRMGQRVKRQTELWLLSTEDAHGRGWRYMDETPTVLISSAKGACAAALKLDAYIDDKIENIQAVQNEAPNCDAYLYTQPWNASAVATKRASSLAEFQAQLERLL